MSNQHSIKDETTPFKRHKTTLIKRWNLNYISNKRSYLRAHNEFVERAFLHMLLKVKEIYKPLKVRVFEYDGRRDTSINPTVMQVFMTASLYLELECEYASYKYQVLYDFHQCPFEQEIMALLNKYPLSAASKCDPRKGGIPAFFKRVEEFQGSTHFTYI